MQTYIVLYKTPYPMDDPLGFLCQAEDDYHAKEQCLNTYPGVAIVWVVPTDDYAVALQDYRTNNPEN